jgi:hypothetical protein
MSGSRPSVHNRASNAALSRTYPGGSRLLRAGVARERCLSAHAASELGGRGCEASPSGPFRCRPRRPKVTLELAENIMPQNQRLKRR